jgi:chromosome segregation ATPase
LRAAHKQFIEIAKERDDLHKKCRRLTSQKNNLEREAKTLKDKCMEIELLEKELNAMTAQRDELVREREFLKVRARRSEAKCDAIRKSMEGLKVETEETRAKFKSFAPLQSELNNVKQQCEDITKERNSFILRAHRTAKSRETIEFERDALKREVDDLRAKIKETDALETELHNSRMQCEELKSERDSLKAKVQWRSGSAKAMGKDIDSLKLEVEKLRSRCDAIPLLQKELDVAREECANIKKERNSYILRAQRVKRERDALKVEAEETRITVKDNAQLQSELSTVRQRFQNVKRQRNSLILRARDKEADRQAMKEEREALKRVIEDLQAQNSDASGASGAPWEEQMHTAKDSLSLTQGVQATGGYRGDTEEERGDIEQPIGRVNVAEVSCYVRKPRRYVTIETQLIGKETDATGKELIGKETNATGKGKDNMKLTADDLMAHYIDAAPFRKRVHTLRDSYGDLTQERDCVVHGEKRDSSELLRKKKNRKSIIVKD